VRMYAFMYVSMKVRIRYVQMCTCAFLRMLVSSYVVCLHVQCVHACMHVSLYVSLVVGVYVCMHTYHVCMSA